MADYTKWKLECDHNSGLVHAVANGLRSRDEAYKRARRYASEYDKPIRIVRVEYHDVDEVTPDEA